MDRCRSGVIDRRLIAGYGVCLVVMNGRTSSPGSRLRIVYSRIGMSRGCVPRSGLLVGSRLGRLCGLGELSVSGLGRGGLSMSRLGDPVSAMLRAGYMPGAKPSARSIRCARVAGSSIIVIDDRLRLCSVAVGRALPGRGRRPGIGTSGAASLAGAAALAAGAGIPAGGSAAAGAPSDSAGDTAGGTGIPIVAGSIPVPRNGIVDPKTVFQNTITIYSRHVPCTVAVVTVIIIPEAVNVPVYAVGYILTGCVGIVTRRRIAGAARKSNSARNGACQ